MLAIVIDENQHSRNVISSMLKTLGYAQTIECVDFHDFDIQCSLYGKKINLIISALQQAEGLDFPLSRMLIQNQNLNLAPLVFLTNRRFNLRLSFGRSRLSRIDSYIPRPFGLDQLQKGIIEAHQRRSEFRNMVLILTRETTSAAVEASYTDRKQSHWEEAVFVHSIQELKARYNENDFKIGGIVFDHKLIDSSTRRWLKRMRKTSLGASTIISILGRTPAEVLPLRDEANFFFDPKEEWDVILKAMSMRLRRDWEAKFILKKIRCSQKAQQGSIVKRLLSICEKRNLPHWEFEEQRGILALSLNQPVQAVYHFQKALEANPAAASVYVRLIPQLSPPLQYRVINKAKNYCPLHPEIQNMSGQEA